MKDRANKKLESIQRSIAQADTWEKKGEIGWVRNCLSSAVMNYLSLAVTDYEDLPGAAGWLRQHNVDALLRRELNVMMSLATEVDSGQRPSSMIAGTYSYLVYAHMAWALDNWELAQSFISIGARSDVLELTTKFWREYTRAVIALVHSEGYEMNKGLKLKGQEKYWVVYLCLIEAVTTDGDTEKTITEINRLFVDRNQDKRIKDDNYQVEGSGLYPVRWDFRRDSLLNFINQRN